MPCTSHDHTPDCSLMALTGCATFYASCERICHIRPKANPEKGQAGLFDFVHSEYDESRKKLMNAINRVNHLEGCGTIRFASQSAREPDWKMKRERLSPTWTTCLQELLRMSDVS